MRIIAFVLLFGVLGACGETRMANTDVSAAASASTPVASLAKMPTEKDLQQVLASDSSERVQIAKFGGGLDDVSLEHHVRKTTCKPASFEGRKGALCRLQFVWLPAGASRAKVAGVSDGLWAWTHMFVIKDGPAWRSAFEKTA